MHPTIMSDIGKARIADWHRQADCDRLARAAQATRTKHASHHLSVTVAGLAAAALALLGCQGAATAASHRPPAHGASHGAANANSLTVTDLKDLAKMKRDLFRRLTLQTQTGQTVTNLKDIATMKRDLFRRLAEQSTRR